MGFSHMLEISNGVVLFFPFFQFQREREREMGIGRREMIERWQFFFSCLSVIVGLFFVSLLNN